jgi:hypothetical protein
MGSLPAGGPQTDTDSFIHRLTQTGLSTDGHRRTQARSSTDGHRRTQIFLIALQARAGIEDLRNG